MTESWNWTFRSGRAGRKAVRRRSAARPLASHETLEPRSLLSGVPGDASARDLDSVFVETGAVLSPPSVETPGLTSADDAVGLTVGSHFIAVGESPSAAAARATLAAAIDIADATLRRVFAGSELNAILTEAFGRQVTDTDVFQNAVSRLRDEWARGTLVVGLDVRGNADLQGHPAAYAAAAPGGGERIYVNGDWLAAINDPAEAAAVLLEEFGHAIDRRL
ncbi:MAG: hypothetical protein ACKOEX_08580, partial [Planctomycetia bacterium]